MQGRGEEASADCFAPELSSRDAVTFFESAPVYVVAALIVGGGSGSRGGSGVSAW